MGGQRGSRRNFAPKVEGWQGARRAGGAAAPAPHGMTFPAARTKAAVRAAPLRTRRGGVGARRRRARPGGAAPRAEESGHSRPALRRRPVAARCGSSGEEGSAPGGRGPELGSRAGAGALRSPATGRARDAKRGGSRRASRGGPGQGRGPQPRGPEARMRGAASGAGRPCPRSPAPPRKAERAGEGRRD